MRRRLDQYWLTEAPNMTDQSGTLQRVVQPSELVQHLSGRKRERQTRKEIHEEIGFEFFLTHSKERLESSSGWRVKPLL